MSGDYFRPGLHSERKRRVAVLHQRSRNGRPKPITDADLNDGSRIARKMVERLARLGIDGTHGEEAWLLATPAELDAGIRAGNFVLRGGQNSDLTAAEAWLGGHCALLYRDVDYRCLSRGEFNELDAFDLHHRASSVAPGVLTDLHAKMVPDALVGLVVHVEGADDFQVVANTATTITLDSFDPGDWDDLPERPWYYVVLGAHAGSFNVYLDVHVEDFGMSDDVALNHNPGGTPVELARREVLVQRVWVQQTESNEMPVAAYKDVTGAQHHVLYLGQLVMNGGDVPSGVDVDGVERQASTPQELLDARLFRHFRVGDDVNGDGSRAAQPVTLSERLAREDSWIVVGPDGDPGIYTGTTGLRDALALSPGRTIFLRNGVYAINDSDLVVSRGARIVGESFNAVLAGADHGVDVVDRATLENLTITAGGEVVAVQMSGTRSRLVGCQVRSTATALTPAVFIRAQTTGRRGSGGTALVDTSVLKGLGCAVRVECRTEDADVGASASRAGVPGILGPPLAVPPVLPDSYGVVLDRCRVLVEDPCGHPNSSRAGLYVASGASLLVRDSLLAGVGATALHVGGGEGDVQVCRAVFSGCDFLAIPSDGDTDYDTGSLTSQVAGDVEYVNCSWDVAGTGVEGAVFPLSMLRVATPQDSPRNGRTVVSGGRVVVAGRGGGDQVYGVALRSAAHAGEIMIDGLEVLTTGVAHVSALVTTSAKEQAQISLRGLRLQPSSNTYTALRACGNTVVDGLVLDASAQASSDDPAVNPGISISSATSFGEDLSDLDVTTEVRGAVVTGAGSAAVYVDVGSGKAKVRLDGLRVSGYRGSSVSTLYGVYVASGRSVVVSRAEVVGVRRSCVADGSAFAVGLTVAGLLAYDYGVAFYSDGAYSVAADEVKDASAVSRAVHVSGLDVQEIKAGGGARVQIPGYCGIYVGNQSRATASGYLIKNMAYGIWIDPGMAHGVEFSAGSVLACRVGIQVGRAGAPTSGRVRLNGILLSGSDLNLCASDGLILSGLQINDCDVVINPSQGVKIMGCNVLQGRVRLHACHFAEVCDSTFERSGTSALILKDCDYVRVRGCTAQGGGQFPNIGGSIDGDSRYHSIVVDGGENPRIQGCYAFSGVMLAGITGGRGLVEELVADGGGLAAWPSGPGHTLHVRGSRLMGTPKSSARWTCSALWAAPRALGDSRWAGITVEQCRVESESGLGPGANYVSAHVDFGRAAGMVLDAEHVNVVGCEFHDTSNSGTPLLVGNLDYIAGASSNADLHRVGCVLRMENNYFHTAKISRLVLSASRCHVIRGNTWHDPSAADQTYPLEALNGMQVMWLYTEDGDSGDPWTRVVYVGNHHTRPDRKISDDPNNDVFLRSLNVLVDAGLFIDEWADYSNSVGGGGGWVNRMVGLNSVVSGDAPGDPMTGAWILADGTMGS